MVNIYADGSCIGNHLHDKVQRKSYISMVVTIRGTVILEKIKLVKATTNQSAEWIAAIEAMKYAQDNHPGDKITLYSDCKNVVNIINGESHARAKHIKAHHEEFEKCSAGLNVEINWVPRNSNLAGKYIESNMRKMRDGVYG